MDTNKTLALIFENFFRFIFYFGFFVCLFYLFNLFGIRDMLLNDLNPDVNPHTLTWLIGFCFAYTIFIGYSPIHDLIRFYRKKRK